MLGANPGYFKAKFHLCQRGFFTLLEQRIDTAILNKPYKDVAGGVEMPAHDAADVPDIVQIGRNDEVNEGFSETIEVECCYRIEEESDDSFEKRKVDKREGDEEDEMSITAFGNRNGDANRAGLGGNSTMPWANEDRPPTPRHFSSDSGYFENNDSYISAIEQPSHQSISEPDIPNMLKSKSTSVEGIQVGRITIQDVQDAQLVITAAGKTPSPRGCIAATTLPFFEALLFDLGIDAAPRLPPRHPPNTSWGVASSSSASFPPNSIPCRRPRPPASTNASRCLVTSLLGPFFQPSLAPLSMLSPSPIQH